MITAPTARLRAERDLELTATMEIASGQPRLLQRPAVEPDRLDVLRGTVGLRLDEARRVDRQLPTVEVQPGVGERRGVDQVEALPGDREQPEAGPDVPGAQPAGVVVAGQPAATETELVVHRGVHHLGGAVRPTEVVVGPGDLHVRLVVQTLEPVERVAGGQLLDAGPLADLLHRVGAVAEELVQQGQEPLVAAGQLDPRLHVVLDAERVVPPTALVVGRVDQQPGLGVEGVHPPGGQRLELVRPAGRRRGAGRPARCSGSRRTGRGCG